MSKKPFDWDRAVVVTAVHGEKVLGTIPVHLVGGGDPQEYIHDRVECHKPIELNDARNVLTQAVPREGSLVTIMALMPIDTFSKGIDGYHLRPSAWYFPIDDDFGLSRMKMLLVQSLEGEARQRAQEAGIVTPIGVGFKPPTGQGH